MCVFFLGVIMRYILGLMLLLFVLPVFGESILVLKSKNLTTYDTLITGFSLESKAQTEVVSIDDSSYSKDTVLQKIKSTYDVVFAIGDTALSVAIEQKDKPVIFAMVLNYEKYPLDSNNVTGVKMNLSVKTQLGVIAALFSNVKNIGVITSGEDTDEQIKSHQQIASLFGVNLLPIKIENQENLAKNLESNGTKADIIWMLPDKVILNPQGFNTLSKYVAQSKKPLYVLSSGLVEKGGLFSLSPDYLLIGKQVARITNKIIYSKVPIKFVPISDPDSFNLTLNYSIAKQIDVLTTLSPKLLEFAATKGFTINVVK